MKSSRSLLAAALFSTIPSLALAQNRSLTNCHTPESSGNFVAADEVLVNGMVCKVTTSEPAQQQAAANHAAPPTPATRNDASSGAAVITNARVIELTKLGLDDDIVIAKIRNGSCQFQLGDSDLVDLKNAGVSAKVIAAMLDAAASSAALAEPAPKAADAPALEQPSADPGAIEPQASTFSNGQIPNGARVVIAPMGGFETYFAAAVREKKVPVKLTLDKGSAQFFVVSTETEWQGFVYGSGSYSNMNLFNSKAAQGSAGSSTRGLEASIMVLDARTKDVVWAYEVHKSSHGALLLGTHATRGQQSPAEACAKHLKEFIEKGK